MARAVKQDAGSIRTIHALALAVDAKDRYTRNHSERVALYATAVAVRIGLPIEADRADRDRRHLCTTSARSPSRTGCC